MIDEFRSGGAPVFLISLKAGGVGLTLTEADYVFVLDPWWNPAAEAQAVDRAHRIGQTAHVHVYRLVASDTIEEKVMELKGRKAELFAQVIDGEGVMGKGSTPTTSAGSSTTRGGVRRWTKAVTRCHRLAAPTQHRPSSEARRVEQCHQEDLDRAQRQIDHQRDAATIRVEVRRGEDDRHGCGKADDNQRDPYQAPPISPAPPQGGRDDRRQHQNARRTEAAKTQDDAHHPHCERPSGPPKFLRRGDKARHQPEHGEGADDEPGARPGELRIRGSEAHPHPERDPVADPDGCAGCTVTDHPRRDCHDRTVAGGGRPGQWPERVSGSSRAPGGLASSQAWKPVSEARLIASSTSPARDAHRITTWSG